MSRIVSGQNLMMLWRLKPCILRFKFDDFANLPSQPGERSFSDEVIDCHGNAWRLVLYPGGYHISGDGDPVEDPFVALSLVNMGSRALSVRGCFILRDALGRMHVEHTIKPGTSYWFYGAKGRNGWDGNLIERSKILDETSNILVDGTLHVDVEIQFKPEEKLLHTPPSALAKNMLQLLQDEEVADTSFKIGGEVISAHKIILRMASPVLFDSCEKNCGDSPIHIDGTTPDIFRIVLRYIYAEAIPDRKTIKVSAKDIIDCANRFGVVGLKLAVEKTLVESIVITWEDAADWLVFSDAKTCPLLKEYAMSICVLRATDVLNLESSKKLKESPNLMEELMREIIKNSDGKNPFNDKSNITVNELRKQLHGKGLDVDGSKEMLLSRLQESNKRKRDE